MTTCDADVLIVGAGPVGLMLAGELRLGGASVIVAEQLAAPTGESRASQLNARTMEVLDQRGLLARLGALERVGAGHFGGLGLSVADVSSHLPGFWKVPQFRTETMLQSWATDLGADVRRGLRLTDAETEPGGVQAVLDGPSGRVRLRVSFVVGCDGAESTVRKIAGIPFPGEAAARELLRADVAGIDVPARRFERHEHGLAISARRPDGVTRVMVHEFGKSAVRRANPPSFDEVVSAWARVTGEDIADGGPIWVDSFGDESRQAARYRSGPFLVAGDAAHVQLPAGGQALNLGLQDAVNLGWKLAATVRGTAPTGLLDSYHDERHPVGARVLTNVRAQGMLLLGGPEVNAARTVLAELLALPGAAEYLATCVSGLDVRYFAGDHPLIGTRLPHVELVTPVGTTDTFTLLYPARGLLLDLCDVDTSAGARLPAEVSQVVAKPQLGSVLDGTGALLVRPDGHVAWAGATTTDPDLATALRKWFTG